MKHLKLQFWTVTIFLVQRANFTVQQQERVVGKVRQATPERNISLFSYYTWYYFTLK